MDQCMVDIGMDGTAYNGDDVLLFGDMDNFTIPLESSAIKSGRLLMSFFADQFTCSTNL